LRNEQTQQWLSRNDAFPTVGFIQAVLKPLESCFNGTADLRFIESGCDSGKLTGFSIQDKLNKFRGALAMAGPGQDV
jgi:hypothetical protein